MEKRTTKNSKERLKNNFENITRVLGFIADITALSLLLLNTLPPSPSIDDRIWRAFLYMIWFIAGITLIGHLRKKWIETQNTVLPSGEPYLDFTQKNETFSDYLYNCFVTPDLSFYFPVLLLLFFFWAITSSYNPSAQWILFIFVIIALLTPVFNVWNKKIKEENNQKLLELKQYELQVDNYINQTFVNDWYQRIEKGLLKQGFVTDFELSQAYANPPFICSKALYKFFQYYESTKDLIFTTEDNLLVSESNKIDRLYILANRHLLDMRPWLKNFYRPPN
jgi:hypothetical protein